MFHVTFMDDPDCINLYALAFVYLCDYVDAQIFVQTYW